MGTEDKIADWSYIGDAVYVVYDGFGFWLHTDDHNDPTNAIYLEPDVLSALIHYAKRHGYEIQD